MKPAAFWIACFLALAGTLAAAPVNGLAFSPDGALLVSGGPKNLLVHSVQAGRGTRSFACPLDRIQALRFDPSGKWLAVAGGTPGVNGGLLLFDWKQEKWSAPVSPFRDLATAADFNATNQLLAVSSADALVKVFQVNGQDGSLREKFTLFGHAGPVLALGFAPDGKSLVTASYDRSLKVWSSADGTLIRSFNHHTEAVTALAFNPAAPGENSLSPFACASGSQDQTVRIWQPEIGRMVRIIRGHLGAIYAVAFSPDGKSLYSAGQEGMVRRLDPQSDTILGSWKASEDWIYGLAVHPQGKMIATGDWSGQIRLWEGEKLLRAWNNR